MEIFLDATIKEVAFADGNVGRTGDFLFLLHWEEGDIDSTASCPLAVAVD